MFVESDISEAQSCFGDYVVALRVPLVQTKASVNCDTGMVSRKKASLPRNIISWKDRIKGSSSLQ